MAMGEPVIGATVVVVNSTVGTTTDWMVNFSWMLLGNR